MSRREDVDNAVWSDPDFLDLSGTAKLVYLWSFTNPRCGMAGLYKVAKRAIAMETGYDGDDLDQALDELEAQRFAFYDGRVMWVRARVKRLRTKSPSIAKSILRDLESVSGHPLVARFLDEYGPHSWVWDHVTRPRRDRDVTPPSPPADPLGTPSGPPRGGDVTPQGKGTGKGKGTGSSEGTTTPPSPPEGGRARDRAEYEESLNAYCERLYPDMPARTSVAAVALALGRLRRADPTAITDDRVREIADTWLREEAA